jgi:hypothetical protein
MDWARRTCLVEAILLSVALIGCGPPPQPRRTPESAPDPAMAAALNAAAESGQLQIFMTDQTSDGRTIKLRGLIRNPYPDTVEGVRVVFRIRSTPDPGSRELDRMQKILNTSIKSREQTALRWDVQTMYAGQGGMSGFSLQAFAIKRGGQELPLPPDWKE